MSDVPFSLVFHPVSDVTDGPKSDIFADAIRAVLAAAPGEVLLVSPYIGHHVLEGITGSREFRLITDVDACFEAGGSDQLLRFVAKHASCVRDLHRVHAKVVLTDGAALVGSANLTEKGLADRDEMSCLIRDRTLLATLRNWFETMWSAAEAFDPSLAESAMLRGRSRDASRTDPDSTPARPARPRRGPQRSLGWLSSRTDDKFKVPLGAPPPSTPSLKELADREHLDSLVARLREVMRSGEEARMVLEHLAEALTVAQLSVDDTRLYVNCRTATSLHVNISSLAVAWCNKSRGRPYFGMMLDDRDLVKSTSETVWGASIEGFKRGSCLGIKVPLEALADVIPRVRGSWHGAIRIQVQLTRRNGKPFHNAYHQRHHFPFFYGVLTNPRMREEAASLAFPLSGSQSPPEEGSA